MGETISLVTYYYVMAPDRPGEAARMLEHLKKAGVNLVAFTGFPKGKQAQLDFVPADGAAFQAAAKQAKWKLTGPKRGFLIQGDDRVGAVADLLGKLAAAKVNVTATDALCAGSGRYAVLLWVKPRDLKRAAQALGV
ncbi:MAG: hypothetical protein ACREJE_02460 [Candidatus Rokuibacteriota bacterium]